jgi:hypothetical protein
MPPANCEGIGTWPWRQYSRTVQHPDFPQEIGLNEDLPAILINFNQFLMGFHGDHMESYGI